MNHNSNFSLSAAGFVALACLNFFFYPQPAVGKGVPVAKSEAIPSTLSSPEDWDKLFDACKGDWEQYELGLNKLRNSLKREIDVMSREEFLRRYARDDHMINFVRVHWPTLLSSKDTGWRLFQGCAERNLHARKLISTVGTKAIEREHKIEELKVCLHEVFAKGKPLMPPFDRLIGCYRSHLK